MPLDKSVESPVSSKLSACVVILSDDYQLPHPVGSRIPPRFHFQNQLNRPIENSVSHIQLSAIWVVSTRYTVKAIPVYAMGWMT